jgi:hypothetical protein
VLAIEQAAPGQAAGLAQSGERAHLGFVFGTILVNP